jgi:hypothetical protein
MSQKVFENDNDKQGSFSFLLFEDNHRHHLPSSGTNHPEGLVEPTRRENQVLTKDKLHRYPAALFLASALLFLEPLRQETFVSSIHSS